MNLTQFIPNRLLVLLVAYVFFSSTHNFAQVGINTTSPDNSSIIDISSTDKGMLIPRMTSAQRDAIFNPANGLLIYNTDSDEFQFNSNSTVTPIWEAFDVAPVNSSNIGQSVKYSNTDTSTNVNQNSAINLPVFGTQEWNDNTSLYIPNVITNQITITETGRYKIIVNASVVCNASSRRAPEMYLEVNGSQVGSYASTGYMRRTSGHNESSIHINEVIEVTAGAVISIPIVRAAQSGDVNLRSAGTTNIYIEKIL
jgi:hypothetical protein